MRVIDLPKNGSSIVGTRNKTRILICLVVLLFVASTASACPTCKQALAQNDESQQAIVSGYFYSILFMMSMPFVIVGTFGSMAWFAIRRGHAEQASGALDANGPSSFDSSSEIRPGSDDQ